MLPNPLRILRTQTQQTDDRLASYDLQVPPFVEALQPTYCDGLPVTLEEQVVALVRGNGARARLALAKPQDSFRVIVRLLNTHLVPSFNVNMSYLCNTLIPNKLHKQLRLPNEALGVTIDQQAANNKLNLPSLVEVRLERDTVTDL